MKKTLNRFLAILVVIVFICSIISGCSGTPIEESPPPTIDITPEVEITPDVEITPPLPTTTSEEAGLYAFPVGDELTLVNAEGQPADAYMIDSDGNVVDASGEVVIAAENIGMFLAAEAIVASVDGEEIEDIDLALDEAEATGYSFTVKVTPAELTYPVVVVVVEDPAVVDFVDDDTAGVDLSALELDPDKAAVRVYDPDDNGEAEVVLTVVGAGETRIILQSGDGAAVAELKVKVSYPPAPAPVAPTPAPAAPAAPAPPAPAATPTPTPPPASAPTQSHTHEWQPVITTIHHDAVTEEVKVIDAPARDAWDETSTVPAMKCRCGQVFTSGDAYDAHVHSYSTEERFANHGGFTDTQVTIVVAHHEATPEVSHYETRVVIPAWDELVIDHLACSCGEVWLFVPVG